MNTVNTIFIRWKNSCWVFDDTNHGLVDEPFVGDTNRIVDRAILNSGKDLDAAKKDGVNLNFSFDCAPPKAMNAVVCDKTSSEGDWTSYTSGDILGWLCPALFHYTSTRPDKIYAWA